MRYGYTLIEVLVGLGIISLVFSVGYASFRDYARREALDNSQEKLIDSLSLARQQSLSGEKPVGCIGNLQGYQISFPSETTYTTSALCDTTIDVAQITLPAGIRIIGSPPPIQFRVLARGTNLSAELIIDVTQDSTGRTRSISITPEGKIRGL